MINSDVFGIVHEAAFEPGTWPGYWEIYRSPFYGHVEFFEQVGRVVATEIRGIVDETGGRVKIV